MKCDLAELRDGKVQLSKDILWEWAVGKGEGSHCFLSYSLREILGSSNYVIYNDDLKHLQRASFFTPTRCWSPLDRFPCRNTKESAHMSAAAGRPSIGLLCGEGGLHQDKLFSPLAP